MPNGEKRPRGGAPKGNLNAVKTGLHSRRMKHIIQAMSRLPEVRDFFLEMERRKKRYQRKAARQMRQAMIEILLTTPNPDNPIFAYMLATTEDDPSSPRTPEQKEREENARRNALSKIAHMRSLVDTFLKETSTPSVDTYHRRRKK